MGIFYLRLGFIAINPSLDKKENKPMISIINMWMVCDHVKL